MGIADGFVIDSILLRKKSVNNIPLCFDDYVLCNSTRFSDCVLPLAIV